jgi:hypothetical protein
LAYRVKDLEEKLPSPAVRRLARHNAIDAARVIAIVWCIVMCVLLLVGAVNSFAVAPVTTIVGTAGLATLLSCIAVVIFTALAKAEAAVK